jgi:hypothetical protein
MVNGKRDTTATTATINQTMERHGGMDRSPWSAMVNGNGNGNNQPNDGTKASGGIEWHGAPWSTTAATATATAHGRNRKNNERCIASAA